MHLEAYEYMRKFATELPLTVIEIGSRDVNGTARDHFPNAKWTGLDLYDGPAVDVVVNAVLWSPPDKVDLVVCCEVLEHARNWKEVIRVAASWLKPGGRLLITCGGEGRIMHSHIDGLELRPGEYYRNITADEITEQFRANEIQQVQAIAAGADTYASGTRSHVIARDWNMSLIEAARNTWPRSDWPHWHKYDDGNSVKYATKDYQRVTSAVSECIRQMAAMPVCPGLFPDLDLHGAGMHWIPEGGYLRRHLDGQMHPLTGWYRKTNAIVFLDSCEGGELVIDGQESIKPEPGKLVMFDSHIWHEVQQVTKGERRSISLFWWSIDGSGERDRVLFENQKA